MRFILVLTERETAEIRNDKEICEASPKGVDFPARSFLLVSLRHELISTWQLTMCDLEIHLGKVISYIWGMRAEYIAR